MEDRMPIDQYGNLITSARTEANNELVPTTALVKIRPEEEQSFIALRDQVVGLLRYAEARIITSTEDVKLATEDLALMSSAKKAIEDKRKEYSIPLNDYLDRINAAFKLLSDPLNKAYKLTGDKVLAYRAEQERKRIEAEEINRQKIELARREAALNEGEITVDTTPIPVPEVAPQRIRTEVGSLGIVRNRKYRILDFTKLPDTYKIENSVLLNKVTKAGIPEIPGVEFYFEESLRMTPTRG